jgi:arginyl-tRNA synthetase
LQQVVQAAVAALVQSGQLGAEALAISIEIIDTKSADHGDYACNFALLANKRLGKPPREIAEALSGQLTESSDIFQAIEVAGPGFLNFRLHPGFVSGFLGDVLLHGKAFARPADAAGQRINVEFVSVNPNGPITVGSGRGAAYGSTLCNVLQACGNTVHREYYINDGVNSEQMRLFAESVRSLTEQIASPGPASEFPFPEKGYKGEYVKGVAALLFQEHSPKEPWSELRQKPISWWQEAAQTMMLATQRRDLATFGVSFDTWFSEQSLHESGKVEESVAALAAKGAADEAPVRTVLKLGKNGKIEQVERQPQAGLVTDDGEEVAEPVAATDAVSPTLWLRSTKFGDDMDRVLRRRDGRLTYIAADVAYHADKFHRPPQADKLVTILGPDHHGYISRLRAVVGALLEDVTPTSDEEPLSETDSQIFGSVQERNACQAALAEAQKRLEVVIFQIVRFVKEGKPAPMRKRDGNIYELRDLIEELGKNIAPSAEDDEQKRIGRDVARFFYLMRSHDTHMDFDIDLATKQSDENPVFYAQYAHARICAVLRRAETEIAGANLSLLTDPKELDLVKKILELPNEVARCGKDYGVHRLTTYSVELARTYHAFYDTCRVIQPDQPDLTKARLALCESAKLALSATFDLLGVSSPERMERSIP